jgi:hypothetical protein
VESFFLFRAPLEHLYKDILRSAEWYVAQLIRGASSLARSQKGPSPRSTHPIRNFQLQWAEKQSLFLDLMGRASADLEQTLIYLSRSEREETAVVIRTLLLRTDTIRGLVKQRSLRDASDYLRETCDLLATVT